MSRITLAFAAIVLLFASGCGAGQSATSTPTQPTTATTATAPPTSGAGDGMVQPALASSELVVGKERFVFGLLDPENGQPINDVPEVSIQFFKVHEDGTATKTGDVQPIFRSANLPAGVYVAHTEFTEAGKWGALMTVNRRSYKPYQVKVNFDVLARGSVPMIGDPAPPSKNMTTRDVAGQGEICSAVPLDDMHDLTIAEAVKSGKPTLVLFAAPGFCPSFTCGPDLQLVQTLENKYRDKANFIHIESPNEIQSHTHEGPVDKAHNDLSGHRGVSKPQVQTAGEWGLKSEPWIFLVDKEGRVANRLEGGLTLDEVEPAFLEVVKR